MKKQEAQEFVGAFLGKTGRLLSNGVPFLSALKVVAAEYANQPIPRQITDYMCHAIAAGKSFAESLKIFPVFPDALVVAIAAYELKGQLDTGLIALSTAVSAGDFSIEEQPDTLPTIPDDQESIDITKLVNELIVDAHKARVSDVLIESSYTGSSVRYRIDGVLHKQKWQFTPEQHRAIVSRIKIMAALDPAEQKLPQDGRILIRLGNNEEYKLDKNLLDVRVSICPYIQGEKVVLRFLNEYLFPENYETLGFNKNHIEKINSWLTRSHGIIAVSGPTGSGKTTTFLMMLRDLARNEHVNILSAENPVEYLIPGVSQMQIKPAIGLTFPAALRSMLRQDPDVIAVAEIQDAETAKLVAEIAHTGHLVITVLHALDGLHTLKLLTDTGIPVYLLRSAFVGVVSQRLVRRLCPKCKQTLSCEEQLSIPEAYRIKTATLYKPIGCAECMHTGYKGRIPLLELFEPTAETWNALDKGASLEQLKQTLPTSHVSLFDDGVRLVSEGLTTVEEVSRVLGS